MTKCPSCGQRKGQRSCPALGAAICSLCCGTKRQKEIACPESCQYLQTGLAYQKHREMVQTIPELIRTTFPTEEHDVFRIPAAIAFAHPIETRIAQAFYKDPKVNDETVYDALSRLYWHRIGREPVLNAENECERVVFQAVQDAEAANPDQPADLKDKTILRILRAIRMMTGGRFGNRVYLSFIHDTVPPGADVEPLRGRLSAEGIEDW